MYTECKNFEFTQKHNGYVWDDIIAGTYCVPSLIILYIFQLIGDVEIMKRINGEIINSVQLYDSFIYNLGLEDGLVKGSLHGFFITPPESF